MPFSCLVNVRVQGADYSDWKNRESVTLFRPEGAGSVYQNIQNPPFTPYALYKSRQAEVQKAFFFHVISSEQLPGNLQTLQEGAQ